METPPIEQPESAKPTFGIFLLETIKTVLVVTFFAIIIRTFLIQPFIVEGHSMETNYHSSDYLLIDKLSYRLRAPERSEVIVFVPPERPGENYIKRIVGLPNERVVINSGVITIYQNSDDTTGKTIDEYYLDDNIKASFQRVNQLVDITLKSDEYYVMGDNRVASTDSRVFGPIKESAIVGRSYIRLFPISDLSVFSAEDALNATE